MSVKRQQIPSQTSLSSVTDPNLKRYLLALADQARALLTDVNSIEEVNKTLKAEISVVASDKVTLQGDVIGSGVGTILTSIATGAVSLTMMADLPASTFVGRNVDTGVPEALSIGVVESMLSHDNMADFEESEHFTQAAIQITESQISDLQSYSLTSHNHTFDSLSNVTITAIAAGEIPKWSGTAWINNTLAEAGISATGHTHTESDITDLDKYTQAEVLALTWAANDIVSGTFADARIAASNVTQHQAALSITESQISDLQSYSLTSHNHTFDGLSNVAITSIAAGEIPKWSGTAWVNNTLAEAGISATGHTHTASEIVSGTLADARISQSSVTQHQAALSITESQISDLGSYQVTSAFIDDDTMATATATTYSSSESIVAFVNAAVASQVVYKGSYDAATNTPNLDTSPTGIEVGFMYTVTVAGTFFTIGVEVGDVLICEQDNPTLEAHWTIVNKDLDAASIKTSYESNANTNAFTDAEKTLLGNQSGVNTGDQTIQLTGDVTGTGTGTFATTIAAGVVALSMMTDLAANTIIGNNTVGAATPAALTATQVGNMLSHGDIANLTADDHTQYLLVDGTRAMTGNLTFSGPQGYIYNSNADIRLLNQSHGNYTRIYQEDAGGTNRQVAAFGGSNTATYLYWNGSEVFRTISGGIDVTGTFEASGVWYQDGTTILDASRNMPNIAALTTTGDAILAGVSQKITQDTGRYGAGGYRIQPTATNGVAVLTLMPSGTQDSSVIRLYNDSDSANTGAVAITVDGATGYIQSSTFGTGTAVNNLDISIPLTASSGLTVTGNITVTGTVDGEDIAAIATHPNTTFLNSGNDLNSYTTDGFYSWSSSNPTNHPSGNYHNMWVFHDGAQAQQMVWGGSGAGTADLHMRRNDSGTWVAWTKFYNTGNAVQIVTDQAALTSGLAGSDELLISDSGVVKRMDVSVMNAYFNANLSFTNNAGTVTSVGSGTGLSGGPITGSGTINFDANSLAVGGTLLATDHLVAANATVSNKQLISAIPLSIFSNDSGWTNNAGTVTSVSGTGTVSGLTLTGTVTSSGNLTLGGAITGFATTGHTHTNYLTSNSPDTATERISFEANSTNSWDTIATNSGSQGCIEIKNNGAGTDAFMAFHVGGDFACYFGLDGGTNKLSVGGWSLGANSYEIYHSGNKPSAADIGAAATSHNHSAANITSGTLAVARGGTGQTSITGLKNVLDDETWTFAQNATFAGDIYLNDPAEGIYRYTSGVGGQVISPGGGHYATGGGAVIGAIEIGLPTAALGSNDMVSFWVDVFEYGTDKSFSVFVASYVYQGTGLNVWHNTTITVHGHSDPGWSVRVGDDGTRPCLWIGDTGTTFNYSQIAVRDINAGYNATIASWKDGWAITRGVTTLGTVEHTFDATTYGSYSVHNHSAAEITSGTLAVGRGGTGVTSLSSFTSQISTSGTIESGRGSGGVALTINDGYGNANLTFNHKSGIPEQSGNVGRIVVNTDSTTGANMSFQVKSNSGTVAVGATTILTLYETYANVSGNITLSGTVDGRDVAADGTKLDTIATSANNYSHPNHTGQVTSSGDGNMTVAVSAITGQTALTTGLVGTDELMVSDGGVLKRMDVSVMNAYFNSNLSFAATSHNHSAANITSGTLAVARGGTGQTSITALKNVLDDETWTFTQNMSVGQITVTSNLILSNPLTNNVIQEFKNATNGTLSLIHANGAGDYVSHSLGVTEKFRLNSAGTKTTGNHEVTAKLDIDNGLIMSNTVISTGSYTKNNTETWVPAKGWYNCTYSIYIQFQIYTSSTWRTTYYSADSGTYWCDGTNMRFKWASTTTLYYQKMG